MPSSVGIGWDVTLPDPALGPGDVHVWSARVDRCSGLPDVLSADEAARADRFRHESDRRRFQAAHVLVRSVLSHYLGLAPEDLVLGADEDRRPLVLWPRNEAWLSFSVSHSGGVALVAVARDQSVGVDVEKIRSGLDLVAIARRALGDAVADELAGLSEGMRTQRFFQLWTREEAGGKCRGTGLIEPHDERRRSALDIADLEIGGGYAAALAVTDRLEDIRCCLTGV